VYLLARTSNPSASQLQELVVDDEPFHLRVARWAAATWSDGRVGLVVGATAPDELVRLRGSVPGPAFLVPGVGAQGGELVASSQACDGAWAPGIVSVSRGIAGASRKRDWRDAAARAAEALHARMREAVLHSEVTAARPTTEVRD
jgi:orotidine-5'-phosphate decarboxylase